MNPIIETASSGESKSALKNLKEFDLQEGKLAVQNYHERLQAAGKNYLEQQAAFAGEKIELYVQEVSASKFDELKVARWPSVFICKFRELDGGTPLHHLIPSLFTLALSGLIMLMISLKDKNPMDSPLFLLCIAMGMTGGFWTLWVFFVSFSEAIFVRKTGYRKSAVEKIAIQSPKVTAFTERFVFLSHRSDDGDALAFKRYAFNDIKQIVASNVEGEILLKAYKPDGSPMFALRGGRTPDGVELEAELEKRIQNARNARYAYRVPEDQ